MVSRITGWSACLSNLPEAGNLQSWAFFQTHLMPCASRLPKAFQLLSQIRGQACKSCLQQQSQGWQQQIAEQLVEAVPQEDKAARG